MKAYDVYCEYLSLKNHFTKPDYDYLKYNGKIRANVASFQKRKDKIFFEKIAKHPDPHGFFLANLVVNDKVYVRDLAYSEHAEKVYRDWIKYRQSLTYNFIQDLDKLDPSFDQNFLVKDGQHPFLLQLYLANQISIESLCILLKLSGAMKHWNKEMEFDLVWDMLKVKIKKYTPFITYDKEKLKQAILDKFN